LRRLEVFEILCTRLPVVDSDSLAGQQSG
jgi:hypothetical protein